MNKYLFTWGAESQLKELRNALIRATYLPQIAENLHRAELTQLERSEQIARWVELVDAKPRQPDAVCKGGRGNTGGVRAASRELGISEPDARRSVKVASISEAAKEAARREGLENNRSAVARHCR